MNNLVTKIHSAARDLSNSQIADRMSSHSGKVISDDTVQKTLSGKQGVMLDNIEAFLGALGLKVVEHDQEVIGRNKLKALTLLAKEGLSAGLDSQK